MRVGSWKKKKRLGIYLAFGNAQQKKHGGRDGKGKGENRAEARRNGGSHRPRSSTSLLCQARRFRSCFSLFQTQTHRFVPITRPDPTPFLLLLPKPHFLLSSQALGTRVYHCKKHISEAGYYKELLSNFPMATLVRRCWNSNSSIDFMLQHMNDMFLKILFLNVIGFVLGKKSSPHAEEENSHSWETYAKFSNITYWNHDYLPSQNDDFSRAFHWLTVAKAVSCLRFRNRININTWIWVIY